MSVSKKIYTVRPLPYPLAHVRIKSTMWCFFYSRVKVYNHPGILPSRAMILGNLGIPPGLKLADLN